jgi:hypothetical protein
MTTADASRTMRLLAHHELGGYVGNGLATLEKDIIGFLAPVLSSQRPGCQTP